MAAGRGPTKANQKGKSPGNRGLEAKGKSPPAQGVRDRSEKRFVDGLRAGREMRLTDSGGPERRPAVGYALVAADDGDVAAVAEEDEVGLVAGDDHVLLVNPGADDDDRAVGAVVGREGDRVVHRREVAGAVGCHRQNRRGGGRGRLPREGADAGIVSGEGRELDVGLPVAEGGDEDGVAGKRKGAAT